MNAENAPTPPTIDSSTATGRTHVVVGAGAVGSGVARRLADAGDHVRLVTRSGSGPAHQRIERVVADAGNADAIAAIAAGAHAIYNCANPSYSKWESSWPPIQRSLIEAAERTGARLVTMGNLYVYAQDSSPMVATDPIDPPTKKGAIRAAMWAEALQAHQAGRIRTTEIRASDFFGPGIGENGHLGDRFVPRLLAGKSASIVGRPDEPHSWTYIGDVCDTVAAAGTDDRFLGRAWHVPTLAPATVTEMADAICDGADLERQKVKQIPAIALRLAGLFSADLREVREMLYQFDRPFVIDAVDTTTLFGLEATPLGEQVAATIASYRDGQLAATRSGSVSSA